jgi:hypothetical protein
MIYVNVSSAVRICQGSEIVIRMKEGIELPVQVYPIASHGKPKRDKIVFGMHPLLLTLQVDGEPWLQSSCEFKLRIQKQAPMMASKSCKWT